MKMKLKTNDNGVMEFRAYCNKHKIIIGDIYGSEYFYKIESLTEYQKRKIKSAITNRTIEEVSEDYVDNIYDLRKGNIAAAEAW